MSDATRHGACEQRDQTTTLYFGQSSRGNDCNPKWMFTDAEFRFLRDDANEQNPVISPASPSPRLSGPLSHGIGTCPAVYPRQRDQDTRYSSSWAIVIECPAPETACRCGVRGPILLVDMQTKASFIFKDRSIIHRLEHLVKSLAGPTLESLPWLSLTPVAVATGQTGESIIAIHCRPEISG